MMKRISHRPATLAAASLIALLALGGASASASASTADYASAGFVAEADAGGDYSLYDGRYLGTTFDVSSTEQVSAIGGNFTMYGDGGDIFGAIVKLSAPGALPGDLGSTALAHVLFTPEGGDQSAALSAVLAPGSYAVVFGSGLWGATGASGLVDSQVAIGSPSFIQNVGGTWSSFDDATLRLTVSAAPVPEPTTLAFCALGVFGLFGLTSIQRRRRGEH